MTATSPAARPASSGIARVFVLAAAAGALLLGPGALAQGWDPTVSFGATPPHGRPQAKAGTAGPKAAAITRPVRKDPERPGASPPQTHVAPQVAARAVGDLAPSTIETGSIKGPRAEEYCANIVDPAADARFAWQKKVLTEMDQELAKRITQLEEKTAEYQKWLARRDEFSRKASETLLRIYARMRPDAAAAQLVVLDQETAASIVTKLEPRLASLILNEMDATKAGHLAAIISGAAKVPPSASRAPPPGATAEAKAK